MNLSELNDLINYHYWATERSLNAAEPLTPEEFTRNLGNSFSSVRDTLVHIYSAEWIWLCRWKGESPAAMIKSDLFPDLATLREQWRQHENAMRVFLAGLSEGDVRRVIEYRLLSGQAGASPLWHMVQHVVNHASYHRGQVTTLLRQLGAGPPLSLDLIGYYREKTA